MTLYSKFRNPKLEELIRFGQKAFGLSEVTPIEVVSLKERGSDRTFYRLRWNHTHSAILIHYDPNRIENAYYADIATFLASLEVPVPKVILHDPERFLVALEDLGDTDLWSLRDTPWEIRRTLYQKTLSVIHKLHGFPEKEFPKERVRLMGGFGPDLYRWERDYFKGHFIRAYCQMELQPSFEKALEGELSSLADRLLQTKSCLIHRDLQSQNVMIRNGDPYLIDFQGMRFGNPFYDLGSLLSDPYVEFNGEQRMELLLYYYSLSLQDLSWEEFQMRFWEASAQRLMQALGAYGFLGLQKGLKAFLAHIPTGVRMLQLSASRSTSLPFLLELARRCQGVMDQKGERS